MFTEPTPLGRQRPRTDPPALMQIQAANKKKMVVTYALTPVSKRKTGSGIS